MIIGSSGVGNLPGIGSSYTVRPKSYSLEFLIQERGLETVLSQGLILKKSNNATMDLCVAFASTGEIPLDLGLMARRSIDFELPLSLPLQSTIETGKTYDVLVSRDLVQCELIDMILKRHRRYPYSVMCGIQRYNIPARVAFTMRIVDKPTVHRPKKHLSFVYPSQERS